jgi:hypothetical protein
MAEEARRQAAAAALARASAQPTVLANALIRVDVIADGSPQEPRGLRLRLAARLRRVRAERALLHRALCSALQSFRAGHIRLLALRKQLTSKASAAGVTRGQRKSWQERAAKEEVDCKTHIFSNPCLVLLNIPILYRAWDTK